MRVLAVLVLVAACGGHRLGPGRRDDPHHLYVEVAARGSHGGALRAGAGAGLASVSFAVPAGRAGDVELQLEVAKLGVAGNATTCTVKILVLRLPQHDLLGIADGSAHVGGTDGRARDDCVAGVSTALVRGKARAMLRRRLDEKR